MLDRYISGFVNRISPEAPVPIVRVQREWSALGGAANVAANVAALGASATLIGLVGEDKNAQQIAADCKNRNIQTELIAGKQPTITKTRIIAGQQIVRVDREEPLLWEKEQLEQLLTALNKSVADCDLILLSDYAKGTLSQNVLQQIFQLAANHNKRVLVDPKRADWSAYSGAYLVSPNLKELALATGFDDLENDDNRVVETGRKLLRKSDVENILCTRSSYGMTLLSKNKLLNIPTNAQEVYDVSGAGDTVLATLGVMLAEKKSISESAFAANAAAGIVVGKRGTAVATRTELDQFLQQNTKVLSRSEIGHFNESCATQKMVFTNGCFDVLHQGHRKLLQEAKALGNVLVVGLNSDDSISRLKGKDRPINAEKERIAAISALPYVDKVVVFSEDTPHELLTQLRVDVLVKGGDYKKEDVVGNELVKQVVIINLLRGVSTTGFFRPN